VTFHRSNDRFLYTSGVPIRSSTFNRTEPSDVVAAVQPGVFFAVSAVLPRGRHQLTREQVLNSQRERLMVAITELMAAKGYAAVGVGEIAERARVSRASFYACFVDRLDCAFAAYERFIDVLLTQLAQAGAAGGDDWNALFADLVRTYFAVLQRDLVTARAFQIEMDAAGAAARERRRAALMRFAQYIRTERARLWTGPGRVAPLPLSAFIGVVYAARQLACDALDLEPEPDLLALAPELTAWMTPLLSPAT
jgi:AcrR family transcriptional regulator